MYTQAQEWKLILSTTKIICCIRYTVGAAYKTHFGTSRK